MLPPGEDVELNELSCVEEGVSVGEVRQVFVIQTRQVGADVDHDVRYHLKIGQGSHTVQKWFLYE